MTRSDRKRNDQLKQARHEKGFTQKYVAASVGVEEQTVRKWENGTRTPSLEAMARLCALFETSPEALGFPPKEEPRSRQSPEDALPSLQKVVTETKARASDALSIRKRRWYENRRRMLQRVQARWITGVLQHSLYQRALITLRLQDRPDAIANPWRLSVPESNLPAQLLAPETTLVTVYDEADGALLILGEPGIGKTTLLLALTRTLLERAHRDETHPIPVVFTLSSWAEKRLSLQDWLIEELHAKYQIPLQLAHSWVEGEQILPLLDGLDEVVAAQRTACLERINAYRQEHGLLPIVVCCRSSDYFAQPTLLLLHKAVVVQPLTSQQIERYLERTGEDLAALRLALQNDAVLQDMASTPLMLSTFVHAYRGLSLDQLSGQGTLAERRAQAFEAYIQRMLSRRRSHHSYTPEQVKRYLGWLAEQMQQQNQTEFHLEHMQPDWLAGERLQRRYRRTVVRLVTIIQCLVCGGLAAWLKGGLKNGVVGSGNGILGLFGGGAGNSMMGWMSPGIGGGNQGGASLIIMLAIVIWLVTLLVGSPSLPAITPRAIGHGLVNGVRAGLKAGGIVSGLAIPFFSLRGGLQHGLSYGLGIGFFLAMAMGLLCGFQAGLRYEQQEPQEPVSFADRCLDGLVAAVGGGFGFMVVELLLQVSRESTLIYSCVAGLFYWLAYGFGGGSSIFPSLGQTIKPAEMVTWSWRQMAKAMGSNSRKSAVVALITLLSVSIAIGGVSSLFFFDPAYGLHYGLVFGTISGLIVGIAGILTSMLKSGWSAEMLPEKQHTTPNEGIARSIRNALLGACLFAPIGGIASGLATSVGFGLIGALATWPVMGMAFALMLAIVFFLVLVIAHGGIAWIEHYTLRWYLWRAGRIPMDYVHFLNVASAQALVRKVGGGYIFAHRLLMDYLAHLSQSGRSDLA